MKLNRLIRKTLAVVMFLAMLVPQLGIVSNAEIPAKELLTTKLSLTEISHLRETLAAQATTSLVVDGRSSQTNARLWMLKFDFSELLESLESFDDLVSVKLVSSLIESNHNTSQNMDRTKEVDYYLFPQNLENWSGSQSWNDAKNAGIINYLYDYTNAVYSEPMGAVGVKTTGDLKSYVISHLNANTSDKVISIGCSARRAASTDKTGTDPNAWSAMGVYAGKGASEPYLEVTYYGKNLVKEIADRFTFDNIKGENEAQTAVVSDLTLPRQAEDARVWWSSDMPEIVNPYNGVVRRPSHGENPITVTLTAEFSKDVFKGSKTFEVIVLPLGSNEREPATVTRTVRLTDIAHIREKNDSVQSKTYLIIDGRISQTNSRMWFTKYDFTQALEGFSPDDIKSVRFFYTLSDANVTTADNSIEKPVDFYVLPQALEGWDGDSLIYAEAEEMGLVDYSYDKYNVCYTQLQMGNAGDYRTLNIAPSIIEHLKSNPGDMVVAMACSSRRATSKIVGHPDSVAALGTFAGINTDSPAPYFQIELYDRAQTLVDTVCDNLTFDTLSSEPITAVTGDLTLPLEQNGAQITWSGEHPAITLQGQVTRGAYGTPDQTGTLKATVRYENKTAEKEFTITVLSNRANSVVDGASAPLTASSYADNALNITFDVSGGFSGDVCLLKLTPVKDAENLTIKLYQGTSQTPVYEETVSVKANEPIYTENLRDAFSGLDSSVTLKVVAEGSDEAVFYSGSQAADLLPALTMLSKETAASEALNQIGFDEIKGANESESSVRYPLTLFTDGNYGAHITWASDSIAVSAETGAVTRQDTDLTVNLTATATVEGYSVSKTFSLKVMRIDTTVGFLESILGELTVPSELVTNDFVLPTLAYEGVTLSWVSENPGILTVNNQTDVIVTRPNEKDRAVKLTVTAVKGQLSASREFSFTVLRNDKNNLLYGKTVLEADSNQGNAIDDKIATVWNITGSNVLSVDRGSAKSVTSFGLVYYGTDISGFDISTSYDGVQWVNQTIAKSFRSGALNYCELESPAYVKYIKVTFPQGVSQVAYFAAYDDEVNSSNADTLDNITIPESVSQSFDLPLKTNGGADITWTSGNAAAISIVNGKAVVTQHATAMRVLLEAKATINGLEVTKSFYVSVLKKASPSGGGGGGGGGGGAYVSPSLGTGITDLAVLTNSNQTPASDQAAVFTDTTDVKWAEPYIIALYQKGIVSGKGEGKYDPFSPLKREELAKLLSVGFGLSGSDEGFSDVSETDWFYPYVCALYTAGIATGLDDSSFGTGADITRQDVGVMIARILANRGITETVSDIETFRDDSEIADYAKDAVYTLRSLEILSGDDTGNFRPKEKITRAEIAKVIYLALKQCE